MKKEEQIKLLEGFLQEENQNERNAEIDPRQAKGIIEKENHFIPLLEMYVSLGLDNKKYEDLHDLIFDKMIEVLSKELEGSSQPVWFWEIIQGKIKLPKVLHTEFALQSFKVYLSLLERDFRESYELD